MRVRIRKSADHYGYWCIDIFRWYWPFWRYICMERSFELAKETAELIKHPNTLEIE